MTGRADRLPGEWTGLCCCPFGLYDGDGDGGVLGVALAGPGLAALAPL